MYLFISCLFLQGVANRGASIRVGRDTEKEGKGYFEDRRPASNMDPYIVTSMIAETTILGKKWSCSFPLLILSMSGWDLSFHFRRDCILVDQLIVFL